MLNKNHLKFKIMTDIYVSLTKLKLADEKPALSTNEEC